MSARKATAQSRGPCYEKELRERHESIRRAPGQKPREILCSSQKRKLIFVGTVRTHKMSFLMATTLPTRGGAYKRKIQLHTPAPHRQAGCGEPPWKEEIQFKSRSNSLSWWTPKKDKCFPPLYVNAVAPSWMKHLTQRLIPFGNIPIWCLKMKSSS